MFRTIYYYGVAHYDEDGTAEYTVQAWKCSDEEEFQYALNVLNPDDIFDIQ